MTYSGSPYSRFVLYVNKKQFNDDKRTLDFATESHKWHSNLFEIEFDDLAIGPKLTRFTKHSPDVFQVFVRVPFGRTKTLDVTEKAHYKLDGSSHLTSATETEEKSVAN